MEPRTLFMIVMAMACICVSTMRLTDEQKQQIKQRYCGNRLSEILSMVCRGFYNSHTKKSLNDLIIPYDYEFQDVNDIEDNQLEYPFLTKMNAHSLIPMDFRKRQTRGIVEECCHKACTWLELQSYCADRKKDNKMVRED